MPPLGLAGDNHISKRTLCVLLVGVFFVSFSLLGFEISLTRLLSVMLDYHYVFVVISMALLGLGAGGIYVYLFRRRIPDNEHRRFSSLALFVALSSLSISLSVILMTRLAADSVLFYSFFLFIPFFFVGVFLAEVFRMFPMLSSMIYGIDLLGAALGSLGVVLILNILGDINTVLALGLTTSIAALLYAIGMGSLNVKRIMLPAFSLLIVSSLLGTNLIGPRLVDIPIGKNPTKEIYLALNAPDIQGEIIETRWSAFGRTDLVGSKEFPDIMIIYTDGGAEAPMYRFNGNLDSPDSEVQALKTQFPGYLPFSVLRPEEKDNALTIGSGGGRDVLLALLAGVGQITAVEVNKDTVDIVTKYADYNGGIYTDRKNVAVIVAEGRNFLKRQPTKYDIIMLSLPVTRTSRSLEGYALTENFLFTTNSIQDYLDHLTDEGRLIVVAHSYLDILRLLSISLEALSQRGINTQAAMDHIYIIGSQIEPPVFVLKKTLFESTEMQSIHQAIDELGYDATTSYLPTIQDSRYDIVLPTLKAGKVDFSDIIEVLLLRDGLDMRPVTDDSPFFYKFERGIPGPVSLVLWVSIIILLLVILVPAIYLRKRASYREVGQGKKADLNKNPFRFVVLFSMIGIGFMLVEISAIQRFVLFLGQPVISLAVLLFSLLVGTGLGSMYSARFASERIIRVIVAVSVSIVVLLIIYAFSLSFILRQFLGLAMAIRILATLVMLTPLGFLMGFLFPSGIRLIKETKMEEYIPWMWGVNGIGSVLGSAATIVIAISFGFTAALLTGAACYFVVLLVFQRAYRREAPVRGLKLPD